MKRERFSRYPQKRDAPAGRGDWIYGRRPVLEVVKAGRRHLVEALLPPPGRDAPEIAELRGLLRGRDVPVRVAERDELDACCEGGHHQGVAVRTGGYPYIAFDQVTHDVKENAEAVVLILDHIEDPQNVGSLLRTADAAGVTAVVLAEDRAAGVTAAAARASAGASEHLRVAKVVNLVRAMKELQELGVWITGLDMGPDAKPHTAVDFKGRVALVVGSEGRGLSRLVRETCDFIACLPMKGRVASLNAGVAGAVALYEVVRQRTR
ncbi:MAG: 23S rRNA (guanosine(2251)-2'-O)-methyltransferase RlmB [Kiritimatiellia bacterium]|jgi:23S rRNA (guanosine2251-2'-O)-methyltransferase|nr:23S rRNA (guanosine(2251)-2'-O)-methyltransferase RlmB [Kiritimatiellia bacterium]